MKTELMLHENLPVARTLESNDSNRGFKKKINVEGGITSQVEKCN